MALGTVSPPVDTKTPPRGASTSASRALCATGRVSLADGALASGACGGWFAGAVLGVLPATQVPNASGSVTSGSCRGIQSPRSSAPRVELAQRHTPEGASDRRGLRGAVGSRTRVRRRSACGFRRRRDLPAPQSQARPCRRSVPSGSRIAGGRASSRVCGASGRPTVRRAAGSAFAPLSTSCA